MWLHFFPALLLASTLLESGHADAAAQPVPRLNGKPESLSIGAVMADDPPPEWSVPWFADPSLVRAQVVAIRRLVTGTSLGTRFPEPRNLTGECGDFAGSSYSIWPEDYWVFRCVGAEAAMRRFSYFYLLGDAPGDTLAPSLQRVRWVAAAPAGSSATTWRGFQRELVDSLSRSLGSPSAAPDGLIVEFRSRGTTTALHLYLDRDSGTPDSLEVACYATRLLDQDHRQDLVAADPNYWGESDSTRLIWAGAVRDSLGGRWSELGAAVAAGSARASDLGVVAAALRARAIRSTIPNERDLVLYAAHLWVERVMDSHVVADSSAARRLERGLQPFGATVEQTHDGDWCYGGGLADSLALDPARNRWTEAVFLERMNLGWEPPCALCGWTTPFGANQWRAVLEHGSAFLADHPGSRIAPDVTLLLAEAHETAWSLSKVEAGDEYIDPVLYRVDAPQHRTQAILLYNRYLALRPDDPGNAAIRWRLARLQIDIDTSYHRFWCLWD